MLEEEFKGTCDRLMTLANTEGQDTFAAELNKINRKLRNQYIDFHGALYAGMFVLRDVRTGEKILPEYRVGNILNWPGGGLNALLNRR
jgi:hypothetical protein